MTGNNSPLERLLNWCAVEVESLRLSNTIPSTGEIDDVATLQEIEQVEADIDAVRRDLTAPPTAPDQQPVAFQFGSRFQYVANHWPPENCNDPNVRPLYAEPRSTVPEAVWKVVDELARAREKFPQWPDDPIHAATIVSEEAGELAQAALQSVYEPDKKCSMHDEAVQTAAMAIRFVENMQQYEMPNTDQHDDRALAQHSEPGRGETCPVCEKGTLTRVECCICDNCDASPVLTDQIRRNDKRLAARSGRIPEGWKLERIGGNRVAVSRPNIGFAIFTNEADENARITIAYELVSAMIDAAPAPGADERE